MKKIEINGKTAFQWEAGEESARKDVEEKLLTSRAVDSVVESLLKAQRKLALEQEEAWDILRALLPEGSQRTAIRMRYDWINKAVILETNDPLQ